MYYLGHDGSRDFPAKFFFLEMATFIFREIPGKSGSYSMISIFQDKIKKWIDICDSPIPSFSFHSTEIFAALNMSKGSFNNYVDNFLPFFAIFCHFLSFFVIFCHFLPFFVTPPPSCVDNFLP